MSPNYITTVEPKDLSTSLTVLQVSKDSPNHASCHKINDFAPSSRHLYSVTTTLFCSTQPKTLLPPPWWNPNCNLIRKWLPKHGNTLKTGVKTTEMGTKKTLFDNHTYPHLFWLKPGERMAKITSLITSNTSIAPATWVKITHRVDLPSNLP